MRRGASSAFVTRQDRSTRQQRTASDLLVIHGSVAHAVQFYETDAYLIRAVTEFLSSGASHGEP